MESQWGACPPNVLQSCLRAQLDYNDNAAAACACKAWRDSFRSEAKLVSNLSLVYRPQRSQAGPFYLRRFTGLRSADLIGFPDWRALEAALRESDVHNLTYGQHQNTQAQEWSDTLQMLPAICCSLTLDRYLPCVSGSSLSEFSWMGHSLSQLANLQHLTIQADNGASIATEPLSVLTSLEVLQVSGRDDGASLNLVGSLQSLPPSITRLQLNAFDTHQGWQPELALNLSDLTHLELRDLDLYRSGWCQLHSAAASGALSLLTRLVLTVSTGFHSSYDDILALKSLRVLYLREFESWEEVDPDVTDVMSGLSCLQELDVNDSLEGTQLLQLSSFSGSFHSGAVLDKSCFQHFVEDRHSTEAVGTPFFKMQYVDTATHPCPPVCGIEADIEQMPFGAVTHLTMSDTRKELLLRLNQMDLPHLQKMDIHFPAYDYDPISPAVAFHLNPQWHLTELSFSHSLFLSYDFAQCTSLVSLGISHRSPERPPLSVPPFLTQLSLHNTYSASMEHSLHQLSNLVSIKLGGSPTNTDVARQLPSLPQSLTQLHLWDGLFTDLQQLSRLTNLKKLFVPQIPTPQQLQCIRQLRQLRHVEVTGCKGMVCLW